MLQIAAINNLIYNIIMNRYLTRAGFYTMILFYTKEIDNLLHDTGYFLCR
jgi:hypothetical protein